MFFSNLKSMCNQNNIKLTQLLCQLEISKSAISRWRSGTLPNGEILIKIGDFFNCSVDYLLGRTENPDINYSAADRVYLTKSDDKNSAIIMKPFYLQPASAGTGSYLFDDIPAEWINVERTSISEKADFILQVRGDSMLPKLADDDKVYIQQSSSIMEGEIGVFIMDGESYIKKMGKGELISLNPEYKNIPLNEYTDCRCVGRVIGIATE